MKSYSPTIYTTNSDNSCRYVLGNDGTTPLVVIGLNPSKADDKKPDRTITKVIGFARLFGCDSFIMINLYAQRTTQPNGLHETLDVDLHCENIAHITNILLELKNPLILASWGEVIRVRPYLKKCLSDIYEITRKRDSTWLKIGVTKSGHPRHPSRAKYDQLTDFDISNYLGK